MTQEDRIRRIEENYKMPEYYKIETRTGRTSCSKPNSEEVRTIRRSELPDMRPVASSNIYAIGYDKANKMMYVLFSKDASVVYRYPQVEEGRYASVVVAESVGKAFASSIKSYSASDPSLAHEKLALVGEGVAVTEGSP